MNLYLRYFDDETVVSTLDAALVFLSGLRDIEVDAAMVAELEQYMNGTMTYPKRFKVRQHSYFIAIRTEASTLEEFKAYGEQQARQAQAGQSNPRQALQEYFLQQRPGYYEASLTFKRVISMPETQKSCYVDTEFSARVYATCIQECYDRVLTHLRSRQDIDPRSQFPSIKGKNFTCNYIGE